MTSVEAGMQVFHVFAQRRSGHHAIIDWLSHGFANNGQTVAFENDVCRSGRDIGDVLGKISTPDVVLVNYEDINYDERHNTGPYQRAPDIAPVSTHHDVLVVRDWYNLVASRLCKMHVAAPEYVPIMDVSWQELRTQWLAAANIAAHGQAEPGRLPILFNTWFVHPEYRRALAAQIGITGPDGVIQRVARIGRGSSFDGMDYDGRAQEMNVLRRWIDVPEACRTTYANVIQSADADRLNRELFGFGHSDVMHDMG